MGKILNAEEGKHLVESYAFKSFDFNHDSFVKTELKEVQKQPSENVVQPSPQKEVVIDENQTKLIEQLLKKTDDLSNVIINLQQQLSNQSQEYEKRLQETKETTYQVAFNEGYNKAKAELETGIKEHLSKLIESVHKIEEVYKEYQSKAENIEKELVGVAVDIAEEVISKELSKNSKEIALNLTKELINDIKEATKIEIKINPLDYDFVKDNVNLEKVEIKPDNAITPGGVVILSDAGNIEAEIHSIT